MSTALENSRPCHTDERLARERTHAISILSTVLSGQHIDTFLSVTHRKKQTNTLYTINALNETIKICNNGVLDTTFQVDWENYRNCIMVTNEDGLRRIDTSVKEIIHIKVKR